MNPRPDNRAVSALFRVFGGAAKHVVADVHQLTEWRGTHHGETVFLAAVVPLTVVVAAGEWLIRFFGVTGGLLSAVPVGFLLLCLIPFLMGAKSQAGQWRFWLGLFVAWSLLQWDAGGVVGIFAWLWIGVFLLNFGACLWLQFSKRVRPDVGWRLFFLIAAHAIALVIGWCFGWEWAVLAGAVIAALVLWSVLRPCCQWLGDVRCHSDSREIWITIDDGPDPHDTPMLLDLLDLHGRKAIFFMIGRKVTAHPELAREVIRRGHEIGNHTMTHPQASFWCAGPWRTRREIAECQRVIEEATGESPQWFRAPVGHRNLFTHPIAESLGLRVMAWSRRGFDAVGRDAEKVLARILPDLAAGDIVLLHEATPIAGIVVSGVLQEFAVKEI